MNSYMVDSPQPASISYMWNFGSLLGACLIIQIITGITLAIKSVLQSNYTIFWKSSINLEIYKFGKST